MRDKSEDEKMDQLGGMIKAACARRFDPAANPEKDPGWVDLAAHCAAVLDIKSPPLGIPQIQSETLEEALECADESARLRLAYELLALFEAKDTVTIERIVKRLKAIRKNPMGDAPGDEIIAFTHAAEKAGKRGKTIWEATKLDLEAAHGRHAKDTTSVIPISEDGRSKWFRRMSMEWMKQKRRDE